jgi:hypothetical protein
VDLFVMVTVACGTTAPLESVTVPRMVPVGAWARALREMSRAIHKDRAFDMILSP